MKNLIFVTALLPAMLCGCNFHTDADEGLTTSQTEFRLNEGDRFLDAKFACTEKSCQMHIITVHAPEQAPRTFKIQSKSDFGLMKKFTVVVEK